MKFTMDFQANFTICTHDPEKDLVSEIIHKERKWEGKKEGKKEEWLTLAFSAGGGRRSQVLFAWKHSGGAFEWM